MQHKTLSKPKLWALAAGGVHTLVLDERYDRLAFKMGPLASEEYLAEAWGVRNSQETIDMIRWLWYSGHSEQCRDACYALRTDRPQPQGNPAFSQFMYSNQQQLEATRILAWDLSRLINVSRWGYTAGYIDEKLAWAAIMQSAKRMQTKYNSWRETGRDFCLGFEFWKLVTRSDNDIDFQSVCDSLLEDRKSPWNRISFKTRLK